LDTAYRICCKCHGIVVPESLISKLCRESKRLYFHLTINITLLLCHSRCFLPISCPNLFAMSLGEFVVILRSLATTRVRFRGWRLRSLTALLFLTSPAELGPGGFHAALDTRKEGPRPGVQDWREVNGLVHVLEGQLVRPLWMI